MQNKLGGIIWFYNIEFRAAIMNFQVTHGRSCCFIASS
jgi:hypothetical protein